MKDNNFETPPEEKRNEVGVIVCLQKKHTLIISAASDSTKLKEGF